MKNKTIKQANILKFTQPNKMMLVTPLKLRQGTNGHARKFEMGVNFTLIQGLSALSFMTTVLLYAALQYGVSLAWHPISPIATAHADFDTKVNGSAQLASTSLTPTSAPHILTVASVRMGKEVDAKDTHKQYIFTKKHGDVIYRIWGLESSYGKRPFLACSKQGKTNEFGFGVLLEPPTCFTTFNEAVNTVDKWLTGHESITLKDQLCLYNTGHNYPCEYAKNFLSL